MLLTENEAKKICEKTLSLTKADDASVSVSNSEVSHVRFAENAFTTSGKRENRGINITVWIGGKRGSSSTNDFDETSIKDAIEQAEKIASLAPADREYMPTMGAQTYKPVNDYVEATANISPAARAKAIGSILTECEKAKIIGAGFYQSQAGVSASATKNGNFNFERSTVVGLSVTGRTSDGTSSGYFARGHFDVNKLDTARIASEAIKKTLEGRNAKTIDPGIYTVVLEPQAVADLLGFFGGGFNARSAEEGRSPYSLPGGKTKLGQQIFDEKINIYSDPWHPELPGSASAQGGIPSQKLYLVRNGVLETLTYNRFWAKQKGVEPTPGPVNTIFEANKTSTLEEMIASTKRGLLVSRFWYIRSTDSRTAAVTGLTRDGLWLIEDGKIKHPVTNFRFNQSTIQMLAPGNVEMIGKSERVGTGGNASLLPTLKLKGFNFTSQSEAV